jgi:alpha-N-acetylglucosaminidase
MGKSLCDTLVAADPEAIWVMQGWIFFNNAKFWKPPQSQAFLGGVPDDRMILLDLFCDVSPVWNKTEAFYGKPWIWCILPSFGNTVRMSGPLAKINTDLWAAMDDPQRGKLSGIGIIQEGLDYNPVVFDLMSEMTWRTEPVDLNEWIVAYAHRRYGQDLPPAAQAWQLLLETVYSGTFGNSILITRPSLASADAGEPPYDQQKLERAWELLLQCSDQLQEVDTYQFDLTNVTRQVLANRSRPLIRQAILAYRQGDRSTFEQKAGQVVQGMLDLDALLATRNEFLLGRWLEDAKRWGKDESQQQVFEWNARNVLTLWGDRNSMLHDYACREWSGMISGFYLPRWQLFFEELRRSLLHDQLFDEEAFVQAVKLQEEAWTRSHETYDCRPQGNPAELASRILRHDRNDVSH